MFAVFASTHLFSLTGGWQSASSREQAFLTMGFSLGLGGFIILQAAEPAIDMLPLGVQRLLGSSVPSKEAPSFS